MKKRLCGLILLLLLSTAALADVVGDYEYSVKSDGTVEITDYRGDARTARVPETLQGRAVTGIGVGAFAFKQVERVILPDTLTSIGRGAFFKSTALTEVVLPEGLTEIGPVAFGYTALEEIVIPSGITVIEETTFIKSGLRRAVLPEGVTRIGKQAFYECTLLEEINIPTSVAEVGEEAFFGCNRLNLSEALRRMMAEGPKPTPEPTPEPTPTPSPSPEPTPEPTRTPAPTTPPSPAEDFTYRKLSDGTARIMKYGGEEDIVRVPDVLDGLAVTSIGSGAFAYTDVVEVVIPYGVTEIEQQAFYNCRRLARVSVPGSVVRIESWAFSGCTALEEIELPASVERIGGWAFHPDTQVIRHKDESGALLGGFRN